MKKLTLLCISLTSILNTHANAMEIYKGKILEHKEWATGGAKAAYVFNSHSNGRLLNLSKMNDENTYSGTLSSHVYSAEVMSGSPTTIQNEYGLSYFNQSRTKKSYYYIYSVCATGDDQLSQCVYYSNKLELASGGYFNDSDSRPILEMTYHQSGKHFIAAGIDSYEGNTHQNISKSYGSIVVS